MNRTTKLANENRLYIEPMVPKPAPEEEKKQKEGEGGNDEEEKKVPEVP